MKVLRKNFLFLILSAVNIVISAFLIHHAETEAAETAEVYSRIRRQKSELYDISSLNNAILALENKNLQKDPDLLKLTGSILDTFKKNRLETISCRTTGEQGKKKIYLKAQGTPENIVKCIYEFSCSSPPLRIAYLFINTGPGNGKTGLTMEVTYG